MIRSCVRGVAAVVLTMLLATAACTSTPPDVAPEQPAPLDSSDQAEAEAALPTPGDAGSAYSATPFEPADAPEEDTELNTCLGIEPTAQSETARAFSSVFTTGAGTRLQMSVTFVESASTANAELAAYASDRAAECVRQSQVRQLNQVGVLGEVEHQFVDPPVSVDSAVAHRLIIDRQSGAPRIIDLVLAVKGRAEVTATFIRVQEPVPAAEQDRLLRLVLDRLDDA